MIVAANWLIGHFGPRLLWLTALVFIPVDLILRDLLHDRWKSNLRVRMSALVISGSALSFVVSPESGRVALASATSFLIAETINTFVYQIMINQRRFYRMNIANSTAALLDSILFPLIAFGVVNPALSVRQLAVKMIGGFLFTALLDLISK